MLLGNGAGGFVNAPGAPFTTNVGTQPYGLRSGDFNGDGAPDLAFGNTTLATQIRLFLGNNTGAFAAAPSSPVTTPFNFPRLAVGKFNGDNLDDIVLTSQNSTATAFIPGNGGAAFAATTLPFTLPSVSDAVTAGDINGDGLLDFVSFNRVSFTVSIFLGNGNGTFNTPTTLTNTPGLFRLAGVIAHINLDACPDLVYVGNDGLPGLPTIYFQNCTRLNIPSATRPGSVLVYPYYTSTADGSSNTRISISNVSNAATTIANQAYVHLFMIDGTTCNQADFFVCLTPNATFSFKASEYDPSNTGYVLAVAVDRNGVPIQNNVLIGNAFVNTPQFLDNYGAEGFWAYSTTPAVVAGNTATLFFNQVNYDAAPAQFAVEIQSPLDAIGQQVITASLNGNLTTSQLTGAAQVGTGQAFNEKETFASFQNWLAGACQARATISTNSPRVPNGLGNLIATGQSGSLKFNVGGAVGLILTPRATTWKGIRALHKTQVVTTTLTIPIFIPVC